MEAALDTIAGRPRSVPSPKRAACIQASRAELAPLSIYHEPWWLDIAADGNWDEVKVFDGGVLVARMPYIRERRRGLLVSRLPSLVRALGPAVIDTPGKPAAALRRRLEITDQLIDQLPALDLFDQLFNPRVKDAVSFLYRGFIGGMTYAFQIASGGTEEQVWSTMHDKTRNVIRRAGRELHIRPIDDPEAFVKFYEENIESGANYHGKDRLKRLLEAILANQTGSLIGAFDRSGVLMAAACIPWDVSAAYHFLSTRRPDAPSGATSLLVWEAVRISKLRGVALDLDGVISPGSLLFLSGFGGTMVQRLRVRRASKAFRASSLAMSLIGRQI